MTKAWRRMGVLAKARGEQGRRAWAAAVRGKSSRGRSVQLGSLLQQHHEAQRDGAHLDEPQRAARDRKDQAHRRAHYYYSTACRYSFCCSSLRVGRTTFTT
jgi:hypothetical protein